MNRHHTIFDVNLHITNARYLALADEGSPLSELATCARAHENKCRVSISRASYVEITLEQRRQAMDRVTWWGMAVNIILAISKLVAGFIAQSHALIADGFHSFTDVIGTGVIMISCRISSATR